MLQLKEIQKKVIPIARKYDVKQLAIFGSYANGTANEDSDIDFLARFSTPVPSIFAVMGFCEELERTLGVKVDVVTLPITKPERLVIEKTECIL